MKENFNVDKQISNGVNKDKLVILPAFNEGRMIYSILDSLKSNTDADILIIDDGSTDNTYLEARKSGVNYIIRHRDNRGYGYSLIEGFKFAARHGYEKAVTMDCDAQHEPEMLEQFFEEIDGVDIVSGSRYMSVSPVISGAPRNRIRINRVITRTINKITGYNLTDAFCGFKCYKVESLRKLELTIPGYGMPLQLWIQASRNNLKVKELPVAVIYHTRESFPGQLASPGNRLRYYRRIIENQLVETAAQVLK